MKRLKRIAVMCMMIVYAFVAIPLHSLAITASNDYLFYVVQNGVSKQANSVLVELPPLDTAEYVIRKIDLKIFQRSDPNLTYGDYVLDGAVKNIEINKPTSLNYLVSFGDVTDYEIQSTYKIAYRYIVSPVDDESQFLIAGEEYKEGWRLAGEPNPTVATSTGLAFYVSKPDDGSGDGDGGGDEDEDATSLELVNFEPAAVGGMSTIAHTVANWDGSKSLYVTSSNSTKWKIEFNQLLASSEVTVTIENADKSISATKTITGSGNKAEITTVYMDEFANKIPDGMYYIYVTATTTNGSEIRALEKTYVAQLALKRTPPEKPIITQDEETKEITITYPSDDSGLFPDELNGLIKEQYKFTPDGTPSEGYKDYTGSFTVDEDGNITAKYTDFAGNTSEATERVEGDGDGDSGGDAEIPGISNAHKDGNRQANVYYINTRRESNVGINSEIFEFLK